MEINLSLLPFSFAAGVATFFNPCFGALLPAYISLYLARQGASSASWWLRGVQGLTLGMAISAGFLTSFGMLGLLFALIGSAITRYLPWVAVSVGIGITLTGVLLLLRPSFSLSLSGVAGRWFTPKAEMEGGLLSFYVYGVFYAICAAACTLPIFLSVMMQTFISGGVLNSLLNFGAYGWGMSIMMLLFSVLLAYSKSFVYRISHSMGHWIQRASGAFMVLAGVYVLYYLLIYGRYLDELLRR